MKAITKIVYVSDNGDEYDSSESCLCAELFAIQATYRSNLEYEPVRDFQDLARLTAFEPRLLAKLEELALLYGMEPRTKSEKGI